MAGGGLERDGGDLVKVVDLSGKQHTLNLKGYTVDINDTRPRSAPHLKCRALLKKLFPLDQVLEEVPIPNEQLFMDFLLPSRKMVIEVQGSQHEVYVPFFHKTKPKFYAAQNRDRRKSQWCAINNLKLVELPENQTEAEWTTLILS